MSEIKEGIKFTATIYKVATLVDGGLRVTLDLPETAVMQAAELMECKRYEVPLIIIVQRDEGSKLVEPNVRRSKRNSPYIKAKAAP